MEYFKEFKTRVGDQLGIFNWNADLKAKYIALAKRCGLTITYTSFSVTTAIYLIFEAHTPQEHAKCLVFVPSSLLFLWWYLTLIFQNDQYTAILDEIEAMINKRKKKIKNIK